MFLDLIRTLFASDLVQVAAVVLALVGSGISTWTSYRDRRRLATERQEHQAVSVQLDLEKAQLELERLKREQAEAFTEEERRRREQAEAVTRVVQGGNLSLDEARRLQEGRDAADFRRNRDTAIVLTRLQFSNLPPLAVGDWPLQPGINLLLGRNGYGKSMVLRALAALLARSDVPFVSASVKLPVAAELSLLADFSLRDINFNSGHFERSIGPVPILAIPDTRFTNRSEDLLRPPADPFTDLARKGAQHLIAQLPYHGIVQGLLHGLCLDYLEHGRTFDLPIFCVIEDVFTGLTDASFKFDSVERIDTVSFRLMVRTEGNPEPIPIQAASQGTLSVLAIFGLIFRFLSELDIEDRDTTQRRAIVLIDELDAHLHPLWQQRITALLRRTFPNVQFVLSAHSPLLVAGCLAGEAAVMRKGSDGFRIEVQPFDFLGAFSKDIYERVFEIEDGRDPTYMDFSERAARGVDHSDEIQALERHPELADQQLIELQRLRKESAAIVRAQAIDAERANEDDEVVRLETELVGKEGALRARDERILALESAYAQLGARLGQKAEG